MSDRSYACFTILGDKVPDVLQDGDSVEHRGCSTVIEDYAAVGGGYDEIEELVAQGVTFVAHWEGHVGAYPPGMTIHHAGRRVDFYTVEDAPALRCFGGQFPSEEEVARFRDDLRFYQEVRDLLRGRREP